MDSHTVVNDWLFDEVMPNTSMAAFKVVCTVARKTWGFQKEWDTISLSQFSDLTGIKGRTNISKGIQEAIEAGYIVRREFGNSYQYKPTASNESLLDYVKQLLSVTSDSNETLPKSDDTLLPEPPTSNESLHTKDRDIHTQPAREKTHGGMVYEHPPESLPNFEQIQQEQEMITALASVVKETYAPGANEDLFLNAIRGLIAAGVTCGQVKAFPAWWKKHGNYQGRPAIKSLLGEIKNSIEWDENEPPRPTQNGRNGYGRIDKKALFQTVYNQVFRQYGPRKYQEAQQGIPAEHWRILNAIGQWENLFRMKEKDFEIAFYQALNNLNGAVQHVH